jgi:chromate transporter
MLLAGGWVLFDSGSNGWREAVAVALTLIVVLRTKINPLWLIITGALAGIAGLVG